MAVEALPHQDALEVRMAVEHDPEHVERLTLMPVPRLPARGDRSVLVRRDLEPDAVVLRERVERVRHAEGLTGPGRVFRIVNAGKIDEIVEPVVPEGPCHFDNAVASNGQGDLPGEFL